MVLVELGLVEQRYSAVCEVLRDGATVTDVAKRYGVARQTVHVWLRRYADEGMPGLVDGSSKPLSCPHQMTPETEAAIVELRRERVGDRVAEHRELGGRRQILGRTGFEVGEGVDVLFGHRLLS